MIPELFFNGKGKYMIYTSKIAFRKNRRNITINIIYKHHFCLTVLTLKETIFTYIHTHFTTKPFLLCPIFSFLNGNALI